MSKQPKKLGARAAQGQYYYILEKSIDGFFNVMKVLELNDEFDNRHYAEANYYLSKSLAESRANALNSYERAIRTRKNK